MIVIYTSGKRLQSFKDGKIPSKEVEDQREM
jgi:hypothetical protein